MSADFDLDRLLEDVSGPIHDAMVESLNDDPLDVSDAAVNRVAHSVETRLKPVNNRWWFGLAAVVAMGALAAVVATQQQPEALPEPAPVAVPAPVPAYEVASAEVIADHRAEIDARLEQGDAYGAWQLFLTFRSRYGPDVDGSEKTLRKLAVFLHQQSRDTDDPDALTQAGEAYRMYFDDYSGSEHEHAMHYAYGEMLYKAKRHDEAFDEYRTVARDFPDSPHAKFCAESAIFAADQMMQADAPGWGQKTIDAAEAYLEQWPGTDPKSRSIRYKAAYLHHQTGDYTSAESHFTQVIAAAPTSDEASRAADLILDGYVVQEDWAGLADTLIEAAATYPEALGDKREMAEQLAEKLEADDPQRAADLREAL